MRGLAKRFKRKIMALTRTTYFCRFGKDYTHILDFSKIFAATKTLALWFCKLQITYKIRGQKYSLVKLIGLRLMTTSKTLHI